MVSIKASYRRLISKSRERKLIDLLPTRVVAGKDQTLRLLKKAKTSSNPCRGLQHFYQYPGELASPEPPSVSPDREETGCRRIADLFQSRSPLKRAREQDDELEARLPSREESARRLSVFFAGLHVPLADYRAVQARLMTANITVQSQREQLVKQQHAGECLISQTRDLNARVAQRDELLQKAESRLNTLERSNQALQAQLQELRQAGEELKQRLVRESTEYKEQLNAKHNLLQETASRLDTSERSNRALEAQLHDIQEAREDLDMIDEVDRATATDPVEMGGLDCHSKLSDNNEAIMTGDQTHSGAIVKDPGLDFKHVPKEDIDVKVGAYGNGVELTWSKGLPRFKQRAPRKNTTPQQHTSSGVANAFLRRMASHRTKSKTSTLLKKLVPAKSPGRLSVVPMGKASPRQQKTLEQTAVRLGKGVTAHREALRGVAMSHRKKQRIQRLKHASKNRSGEAGTTHGHKVAPRGDRDEDVRDVSSSVLSMPAENLQTLGHNSLAFATSSDDDWLGVPRNEDAMIDMIQNTLGQASTQNRNADEMFQAFERSSLDVDSTIRRAENGAIDSVGMHGSIEDTGMAAQGGVKDMSDSSAEEHTASKPQTDVSGIETFSYELRQTLPEIRRRCEDSGYLSDDSGATTKTPGKQKAEQKNQQRSRGKETGILRVRSCNLHSNKEQATIRSLDTEATPHVPGTASRDTMNNIVTAGNVGPSNEIREHDDLVS